MRCNKEDYLSRGLHRRKRKIADTFRAVIGVVEQRERGEMNPPPYKTNQHRPYAMGLFITVTRHLISKIVLRAEMSQTKYLDPKMYHDNKIQLQENPMLT